LQAIQTVLGREPLARFRTRDKQFRALGLSVQDKRTDNEWLDILAANPVLLERPVVAYRNRFEMGRPPEKVLDILK